MNKRAKGASAEERAAKYLAGKGYVILERNLTLSGGEADIVAKSRDNVLVFAEVKARDTLRYGSPAEAVTYAKRLRYKKIAEQYTASKRLAHLDVRFDVIEIFGEEINHIENAFDF